MPINIDLLVYLWLAFPTKPLTPSGLGIVVQPYATMFQLTRKDEGWPQMTVKKFLIPSILFSMFDMFRYTNIYDYATIAYSTQCSTLLHRFVA